MKTCVFTLGCKVNEVESASYLAALEARGYEVTDELGYADLYLVNTCAVTAEAEKKSRQAIARVRKFNPAARVIVCGCAAQNHPEAFSEREGVTLVTGAMHKDRVLELLDREGVFLEEERAFCELPAPKQTKTRAFLRIQDGCNRFCSYCLIPYLRGRTRSRSADAVVREAEHVSAREIVLTGIDITSYRDGETDLGGLLLRLAHLPSRIRLGSLEEGIVTREFLGCMKAAGNVVPHFHLSLQSGSDAVLRAMNRRYTRAQYLEACALIDEYFPDAAVTTDIFPRRGGHDGYYRRIPDGDGGGLRAVARHRPRGGAGARARLPLFETGGNERREIERPARFRQKGAHGAHARLRRAGGGGIPRALPRADAHRAL